MDYEIKLTEQEINIVLQALGELPLKVSINTFNKIHAQVLEAQKPK